MTELKYDLVANGKQPGGAPNRTMTELKYDEVNEIRRTADSPNRMKANHNTFNCIYLALEAGLKVVFTIDIPKNCAWAI